MTAPTSESRSKTPAVVAVLLVCLLGALWSPAGAARVKLFVSVIPLKHFAERVGGDLVEVEALVQPGHSPVTYEPTPRQMAALAQASGFVRIGVPFETVWLPRLTAANPAMAVIDAREGIDLLPVDSGAASIDAGHDHGHQQTDPHVWLDPAAARVIASHIRDFLISADPVNGDTYRANAERLFDDLEELDAAVRALTARAVNRRFVVFHPAWGYFARAYGLQQVAVEHEGKEPGPRTLARVIERIRAEGIGTVFVQRQFSDTIARTLAAEIGGVVAVLDPLAEDYFANLMRAAEAISRAN